MECHIRQIILVYSDYKNVTANLGIKSTVEQVRAWEKKKAELQTAGKRVPKNWKTPGTLGIFYREYVGREIANYHSALVDAVSLHEIELHCAELKEKREKWRQTRHLAKPMQELAARVINNDDSGPRGTRVRPRVCLVHG